MSNPLLTDNIEEVRRLCAAGAVLIGFDGSVRAVMPENGTDFTLEELYQLLDITMVQIATAGKDLVAVFDEEGMSNMAPVNVVASQVLRGILLMPEPGMLGNVIICGEGMIH
jgi:hypothetical protein